MRATQTRRLLVFAVCALGVTSLYVFPDGGRSPARLEAESPRTQQPRQGLSSTSIAATSSVGASASSDRRSTLSSRGAEPVDERAGLEDVAVEDPPARTPSPAVRRVDSPPTPGTDRRRPDPAEPRRTQSSRSDRGPAPARRTVSSAATDRPDSTPPDTVAAVRVGPRDRDSLTLSWDPAADDVAVVGYRVWLNGFEVASTSQLSATVDWFNDDMGDQVVLVRAFDAAGNTSDASPGVLVSRPPSAPTAATAAPTAQPTAAAPPTSTTPSSPSSTTSRSGPSNGPSTDRPQDRPAPGDDT